MPNVKKNAFSLESLYRIFLDPGGSRLKDLRVCGAYLLIIPMMRSRSVGE